jgi:hypothetical protein
MPEGLQEHPFDLIGEIQWVMAFELVGLDEVAVRNAVGGSYSLTAVEIQDVALEAQDDGPVQKAAEADDGFDAVHDDNVDDDRSAVEPEEHGMSAQTYLQMRMCVLVVPRVVVRECMETRRAAKCSKWVEADFDDVG